MPHILDQLTEEFRHRECAHWDIYPEHFACSVGAHIFNLVNQETEVLVTNGIPMDTRMHMMFVAPPGFSKTFWLEQYLRSTWCILHETNVQHGFEGSTTEAGFVGSATLVDGECIITPGLALIYKGGIVGFEEFSALIAMMYSQHSKQLDAALLLALDKGYVVKRLRAGKISYKTNVSVWAGTQPARFDLTSGLGRRFYYCLLIPTKKDRDMIRAAMRKGWNVRMDKNRTSKIRHQIDDVRDDLFKVKKIVRTPQMNKLLDELKMPPYEELLYIRSLIGYKVMTGDFGSEMVLDLDDRIEILWRQESLWRTSIRRGPEIAQLLSIMQEFNGKMGINDLKDAFMDMGVDWRRSTELIDEAKKMKIIDVGVSMVVLRKGWMKKQGIGEEE